MTELNYNEIVSQRQNHAKAIAAAGGIEKALANGMLSKRISITLSEAVVLGLLRQGVKKYIGIFGHGSTEIAEVLRVYEEAGIVKTYNVRNEVAASHSAAALRWATGEKAAVITSIGPGALQAMAGSLTAASDGLGVWYLLGEETTEDEGPNMQQIPGNSQSNFLKLFSAMGKAYSLHSPGAINTAMTRGLNATDHPVSASPFYLLMPMNTQCSLMEDFNMDELPVCDLSTLGAAADGDNFTAAVKAISQSKKVVVKVGGGARSAPVELAEFLELADAAAVTSPLVSGVLAYDNPRNMTVGGSKGSICGNFAMDNGELLIAVGTRFVCQSDSSRTGYPKAKQVVTINGDIEAATHYNKNIPLIGDIKLTLAKLNDALKKIAKSSSDKSADSDWFVDCKKSKVKWETFKQARYDRPTLKDDKWKREVLTQPAAIKAVVDWAKAEDAVTFFDAGDVQANGFQIVEDDKLGRTFTDTGASYMGFAASAIMAGVMADEPFYGVAMCGDGCFMMNPQVLIDAVEHRAKGLVVVFDNREMAAISGLQKAQYGEGYATSDTVEVDYVQMADSVKGVCGIFGGYSVGELQAALKKAKAHDGLSLIHVPVYCGADELGGMGVFGRWNVGPWCGDVQALRHDIGL